MDGATSLFPSMIPDIDEVIIEDDQFDNICKSKFDELAKDVGLIFRRSLLTKSPRWGLLWRADFDIMGEDVDDKFVNRITYWFSKNCTELITSTSFGKEVDRLELSPRLR